VLGVVKGQTDIELLESDRAVERIDDVPHAQEFLLHLALAAEHVRVVLGEGADAGESVQFSCLLVAVARRRFRIALGQVLVAALQVVVDLRVVRAVHRFHREFMPFARRHLEQFVLEFLPVSAGLVEFLLGDVRDTDAHVAARVAQFPDESVQLVAHLRAARRPERKARTHEFTEREEVHLLSDLAVVALLRFLLNPQVFIKLLFGCKGGDVDTRELLAFLIPSPVGAGDRHQFETVDGDFLEALHVSAAAEVHERVFAIRPDVRVVRYHLDVLVLFQILDQFHLERLPLLLPELLCFLRRQFLAAKRLALVDDLLHFLLDLRQMIQ